MIHLIHNESPGNMPPFYVRSSRVFIKKLVMGLFLCYNEGHVMICTHSVAATLEEIHYTFMSFGI